MCCRSRALFKDGRDNGRPGLLCLFPLGSDVTSFKSADSFVAVAMALENTGVMAYDGAIRRFQPQI